jgi:hypothetical protein
MTLIAFAFLQHLRLEERGKKQPRITTGTATTADAAGGAAHAA